MIFAVNIVIFALEMDFKNLLALLDFQQLYVKVFLQERHEIFVAFY